MWVRRLAAAAAFLTLVLIVAGGLVTNTDSGLACPDWPTCFGSPMPHMVGGVAVEHTHRLIATAVGLCTLGLCIGTLPRRLWLPLCGVFAPVLLGCAWVLTRARGPGRLAVLALALVMAQGLLGGVTVIYGLPPTVLVLHLATSMLFLAVALVLAWRVSGARTDAARTPLLWVTAGLTYFQIVLGAAIRHTGAGLVCTDLPYCRGAWWPTGVHPSVHVHMLHRALAFAVLALVLWNAVRLSRGATGVVRLLASAGPALTVVQMVLGVLTILTFKDLLPVTGHLLFAALLLADLVSLLALTRPAEAPQPARGSVGVPA